MEARKKHRECMPIVSDAMNHSPIIALPNLLSLPEGLGESNLFVFELQVRQC